MSYKALNTFIDDLFAFVIRMPIMHRLACLRDDVVFVIFLYQKHIYKIDYSRVNEYGQGGDDDGTATAAITAEKEESMGSDKEEKKTRRRGAREKME